jgi:hypothetical protein
MAYTRWPHIFKFIKIVGNYIGIWHYEIASISSVKRLLARTLFAKPPESTYDEALRHFERAEALQVISFFNSDIFRDISLLARFLLCESLLSRFDV